MGCEKNILGKEIKGFAGLIGHIIVGWEKKEKIKRNKADAILNKNLYKALWQRLQNRALT